MSGLRMIGRCRVVCVGILIVAGIPVASGASMPLQPLQGNDYVETTDFGSGHLQGITTNGTDAIYWSFTDKLVKTDTAGNTLGVIDVIDHHGDLTFASIGGGGKVYVAVNDRVTSPPGQFNVLNPNNPVRQWIYEYNSDLTYVTRHAVPEVVYGAGGVAYHAGKFLVVGGLATHETKNYVYEYDESFTYLATRELETGYTDRGIQTAEFAEGHWWFGTYQREGGIRQLLKFNESLEQFSQYSFDASLGIAAIADGQFLIGTNRTLANGNVIGRVNLAIADQALGLKVVPIPVPEPQTAAIVSSGILVAIAVLSFRHRRRLAEMISRVVPEGSKSGLPRKGEARVAIDTQAYSDPPLKVNT